EFGHSVFGEEAAQAVDVGAGGCFGNDDGACPLSGVGVGQADDGDLHHLRMAREDVLDLLRGNVLAATDDDVFGTTGHHEVILVAPLREIACSEIAFVVKTVPFVVRIPVSDKHLGSAGMNLARAGWSGVVGDQLDIGNARPSVGVGRVLRIGGGAD